MKRYPKYKDSGIEWIGDIPENWDLKRLKFLSAIKTGESDTIDREDNGKYPFFVRAQTVERINTYSYDGEAVLTAGDGVGVGRVFHYINGKFDYHQRVYKISDFKEIVGKYFFYYMKENFHKEVMKISAKSTVDSLRLPMFLDFPVAFGGIKEQQSIAHYLDRKTHQIDTLIDKKQKQIELLKEQRTAIINHAVTKGLNPNVKMKDSGIEWLGEIPEHWLFLPIKWMVETPVTDGPHETPDFLDDGIPFISAEAIKNDQIDFSKKRGFISQEDHERFSKKYRPRKGDIYMVKSGATTGNVAVVETDGEFNIWSPLAVIRPDFKKAITSFVFYFMKSKSFFQAVELGWSYGTQQNIGMGVIENISIVLPPIPEQKSIASFLSRKISKIDHTISGTEKEINLIKEYRTILISDAVTGKIDVRDEVQS